MLDAKDGFGRPVRHAGPRLPLILAKAEDNRVFIYNTHHVPPRGQPPAGSACNSSYVHVCAGARAGGSLA